MKLLFAAIALTILGSACSDTESPFKIGQMATST